MARISPGKLGGNLEPGVACGTAGSTGHRLHGEPASFLNFACSLPHHKRGLSSRMLAEIEACLDFPFYVSRGLLSPPFRPPIFS